jgi:hypothetical protein
MNVADLRVKIFADDIETMEGPALQAAPAWWLR